MKNAIVRRLLVAATLCVASVAIWGSLSRRQAALQLDAAARSLAIGDNVEAQRELNDYLTWYPNDGSARLILAESLLSGASTDNWESIERAIDQLQLARQDTPSRARALIQEARLQFLLKYRPFRAEGLLREAIAIDPTLYDGSYLMWKLLDATLRSDRSEPWFRTCYGLAPPDQRLRLLREWYLSQFSPGTANTELDRRMGFLGLDETPRAFIQLQRLLRFQAEEPDSPDAHAAVAKWYMTQGNPILAIETLNACQQLCQEDITSFYIATLVPALLDRGDFEQAVDAMRSWPEPHEGYDYWKWTGVVPAKVVTNDHAAVDALLKATDVWPGLSDASLHHRLTNCLIRLRRNSEAEFHRDVARRIDALMELELHAELRRCLAHLDDPSRLKKVAAFYADLGCEWEAAEWSKLLSQPENRFSSNQTIH